MKPLETDSYPRHHKEKLDKPFLILLEHKQFTKVISRTILGRHGITQFNTDGLLQGSSDQPLSATGIHEIEQEADLLSASQHNITSILSSNMVRAKQTADIFSKKLGNIPTHITQLLQEYGAGSWEGRKISELITIDPHHNKWTDNPITYSLAGVPENGESFTFFLQRINSGLHFLNEHITSKAPGDNGSVLLITHATTNRAIRFLSILSREEGASIATTTAQKHEHRFFFQGQGEFIKIPHGIFKLDGLDDTLKKIEL